MNYDLKNKLNKEFSSETPDVLSKVMAGCSKEDFRERYSEDLTAITRTERANSSRSSRGFAAMLTIILVFSFALGIVFGDVTETLGVLETQSAYVFVEFNDCGYKFVLNKQDEVLDVVTAGEKAEKVLSGLNLENADFQTSFNALIASAYMTGNLSDSAEIFVTVSTTPKKYAKYLDAVEATANGVSSSSSLSLDIACFVTKFNADYYRDKFIVGSPVYKQVLIKNVIDGLGAFGASDYETLSSLSDEKLVTISNYCVYDKTSFSKEFILGERFIGFETGYVSAKSALEAVLTEEGLTASDLTQYFIYADFDRETEEKELFYTVRFSTKDGNFEFNVDAVTCEII